MVIYSKKCIREASKLHPGQFMYLQSLHKVPRLEKRYEEGYPIVKEDEELAEGYTTYVGGLLILGDARLLLKQE